MLTPNTIQKFNQIALKYGLLDLLGDYVAPHMEMQEDWSLKRINGKGKLLAPTPLLDKESAGTAQHHVS